MAFDEMVFKFLNKYEYKYISKRTFHRIRISNICRTGLESAILDNNGQFWTLPDYSGI